MFNLSKFVIIAISLAPCTKVATAQSSGVDAPPKSRSKEKTGSASPRLYNQQLDDQAQSALPIAKEIANGALFDTELHNVDLLSQQSMERIFSSGRRLALSRVGVLFTWQDVANLITDVRKDLSLDDFPADGNAAKVAVKNLSDALNSAKKKVNPSEGKDTAANVFAAFKKIGSADSAFAAAQKILDKLGTTKATKDDLRAAQEFTRLFGRLSDVYDRYKAATALPPSASDIVADTHRKLIAAELDHVTNLLQIATRRGDELVETNSLLTRLTTSLDCIVTPHKFSREDCPIGPDEASPYDMPIEITLRQFVAVAKEKQEIADHSPNMSRPDRLQKFADAELERQKVNVVTRLLYLAAAVASRADLPVRLAESRMAQEEHRYGIRRNAVLAQSYERVVGSGVERLALFYKGGIKPEVIAQLVQSMATLGLIPAVLTR